MVEEAKCWICHRQIVDIEKEMAVESEKQKTIKAQTKEIEEEKKKFVEQTNLWMNEVASPFDQLDLDFLLGNKKQFNGISFLPELGLLSDSIFGEVEECLHRASNGDYWEMEKVSPNSRIDRPMREMVLKKIKEFEKNANRKIQTEKDYFKEYPENFRGMKPKEGIMFLQKLGMLRYEIQEELLNNNLSVASERPSWKLNSVKLGSSYPKEIVICDVCQDIIVRISRMSAV
ncbi:MAG: hypothetical protein ABSD42_14420 [Candidatus Bathyarchaeia archaeon]|jgi:vacuolar-type H+-ATPase subunit H